jgi:hypothetical protein
MAPIQGNDGTSGLSTPSTFGVWGDSAVEYGVVGTSGGPAGVYGLSNKADFPAGIGVLGENPRGTGTEGHGLIGVIGKGSVRGVSGVCDTGYGTTGVSTSGTGVAGSSDSGTGVLGQSNQYGIRGLGGNIGVYAQNQTHTSNVAYLGTPGLAADFYGSIWVHGVINKSAVGFAIDHPLDPANRYLHHGCVEAPEWKTVYDGTVTLDGNGEALVELPAWFGALNKDFRYQLTCLGRHAPVFVAQTIADNRFRIGGGAPGLEVSWQVTGVRHDAWAKANPLHPERDKPEAERGSFLHPSLYGEPEEKSVRHARYPEAPAPSHGDLSV